MTTEQAVTSSTRSGAWQSEQGVTQSAYNIRTFALTIAICLIALSIKHASFRFVDAIEKLKPTITLHEHPTKIEIIQPKPLLPEVR